LLSRGGPGICVATHAGGHNEEIIMFGWVIALFIIAIVAAVLGFGGIAASAASIAQVVFWIALVLAVIGFFVGRTRV
jgi:uncharacterized membrane protein YtjA (UPF0391 family)